MTSRRHDHVVGQLHVFDPETLEDYTMADITAEEQHTLRMRMASYFPPMPEVELIGSDPGDECQCEGCS